VSLSWCRGPSSGVLEQGKPGYGARQHSSGTVSGSVLWGMTWSGFVLCCSRSVCGPKASAVVRSTNEHKRSPRQGRAGHARHQRLGHSRHPRRQHRQCCATTTAASIPTPREEANRRVLSFSVRVFLAPRRNGAIGPKKRKNTKMKKKVAPKKKKRKKKADSLAESVRIFIWLANSHPPPLRFAAATAFLFVWSGGSVLPAGGDFPPNDRCRKRRTPERQLWLPPCERERWINRMSRRERERERVREKRERERCHVVQLSKSLVVIPPSLRGCVFSTARGLSPLAAACSGLP